MPLTLYIYSDIYIYIKLVQHALHACSSQLTSDNLQFWLELVLLSLHMQWSCNHAYIYCSCSITVLVGAGILLQLLACAMDSMLAKVPCIASKMLHILSVLHPYFIYTQLHARIVSRAYSSLHLACVIIGWLVLCLVSFTKVRYMYENMFVRITCSR